MLRNSTYAHIIFFVFKFIRTFLYKCTYLVCNSVQYYAVCLTPSLPDYRWSKSRQLLYTRFPFKSQFIVPLNNQVNWSSKDLNSTYQMILENSSNPSVKKYQIPIDCLWRKGKKTSPALAYDEHDGNVTVMDGHLVYGDFGTMTRTLPSWYCRG